MKKIILVLLFSCFILSSCTQTKNIEATVTKTGTLTMKVGEDYLLKTDSGIINITSTKVNLDNYIKKKISVTGQFSGSTLYVDEIN
jgi:PBP1b-binding outer membrane lipoprotein LpoB